MPRYIAVRDTWLSHESRMVRAGEEFETEFPKVKVEDKLIPMRLSDNLALVKPSKKTEPDDLA